MSGNNQAAVTKGLILAAGLGTRLRPLTMTKPKCLLIAGDHTILEHALMSFNTVGIHDLCLVTGYKSDLLKSQSVPTIYNPNYENDNILGSFYQARQFWQTGTVCCYSDILFDHRILADLLSADPDISIVVDPNWHHNYVGRKDHPVSEAELVISTSDGLVEQTGKGIPHENAAGEFIGMFKISSAVAPYICEHLSNLIENDEDPLDWKNSYLTRYFNKLIADGLIIRALACQYDWHEIDTLEDLDRLPMSLSSRNFKW